MQAVWRGGHLQTQPHPRGVHVERRGEHLQAQPHKKWMQGVRRVERLQAQPHKKWVQDVPAGAGRLGVYIMVCTS